MADHSIKLSRALNITKFLPMQQRAILESVPPELVANLRAADLALVMQALNKHWHKAVAHATNEILADGYVYDPRSQKLRDLLTA